MNRDRQFSPVTAILLSGLIAGTIDVGAACLINGLGPVVILHAIASGALGKASFHGGLQTAGIGLVLQWVMGIIIAAIYIGAAQLLPLLGRAWLAMGLLYGVGIFFVMNLVVVPLSNAGFKPPHFEPVSFAKNMAAMLLFGVIIAWFARGTIAAANK
jgi:uncharacterized membrane protein YagU involved in acid resistance